MMKRGVRPNHNLSKGPAERQQLDPTSPWWGEHCSRYYFALNYVRNKTVLDIACGTGFGVDIIAKGGAEYVIGVDISEEAINIARNNFVGKNIEFQQGDGTNLDFADKHFDVITSFETIEHIPDYERFLFELRRVIKDDGILIISTPNSLITRPQNGKPTNPYHIREFSPDEFRRLLAKYYSVVELYGQTLSERYKVAPFLPKQVRPIRTPLAHIRLLSWKVQRRLPHQIRELFSQALTGHSFYPTQHDYDFDNLSVEHAHVLLAVCQP